MGFNFRSTISYKSWLGPALVFLLVTAAMVMTCPVCLAQTAAEDPAMGTAGTEVTQAESLDDFIDQTAPDQELLDQDIPEPQATEPALSAEDPDDLTAYAMKRILVDVPLTSFYGAESAVEYEDQTVLTFATEAETRAAYQALTGDYGQDHVLLDGLMSLEDENSDTPDTGDTAGTGDTADDGPRFHGWGTEYMGMQYQLARYEGASEGPADPVTIAVLDSGINKDHEIFQDVKISDSSRNFVQGTDRKIDPAYLTDDFGTKGHGTAVSGIIAESMPKDRIELMVLKVADENGRISLVTMQIAIVYARDQGADIINMSFSGQYEPYRTVQIEEALKEAAGQGVILCASSGNDKYDMDEPDRYIFPAESPNVLCVGAINNDETIYFTGNYGDRVDFTAPGTQLETALSSGPSDYGTKWGTSFSSPYIAACAAYLKLDQGDHNLVSARCRMIRLAADHAKAGEPVHDSKFGYGQPAFAEDSQLGPAEPIGKLTVTASGSCVYKGRQQMPSIAVSFGGLATSAFDTQYLTGGAAIGAHKVRVTMKGCFTEAPMAEVSYKILPARPAITKLKIKRPGSKKKPAKARLTWSKGQRYYQVQLSRKSSFSSKKTWTTKKRVRTVKNLKRGKTYYVRVRTGKKTGGSMYWSAWSKVRKIKVR